MLYTNSNQQDLLSKIEYYQYHIDMYVEDGEYKGINYNQFQKYIQNLNMLKNLVTS